MPEKVIYLGMDPSALHGADRRVIEEIGSQSGYRVLVSDDVRSFEMVIGKVVIAAGQVPRERLAEAPALRWFQQFGSGCEWLIPREDIRNSDLLITNASDNHYNSLAEHVMAMVLTMTRQIHFSVRAQSERRWHRPAGKRPPELSDLTMLLLGVGSIGKRVAELATSFGMRTMGVRRNPTGSGTPLERCVTPEELLDILPEADIVSNSMPLTPDTHGMINREAFRAMKNTALFFNVGRGKTVDETALIEALQNDEIAGAGLDVFETEPLPPDSPLWEMRNVVITGHYAGSSESSSQRRVEVFTDNLRRFVAGGNLRNVVDKRLYY
jgi:phosphoglycerate dehydrogenase-like enzyme